MLTGSIQRQTQFSKVNGTLQEAKSTVPGPLVRIRGRIQKRGGFRRLLQPYLAQRKFQNVVMDKESCR